MNRCGLPPQSRATFPQGLEHHYLPNLKLEEDTTVAPFSFPMQQTAEYPSTPFSAPAMSASSSAGYDSFEVTRRPSTASGYVSAASHGFYSPQSNHGRMCHTPTPTSLTPASEISQFPHTPDFRDARAFEVHSAGRPQFSHLSIGNMTYGACGADAQASPSGFHGAMMGAQQSFAVMPNLVMENQAANNIDPNLWDAGTSSTVPAPSMGSHFYEHPRHTFQQQQHAQQQHMHASNDFAQPATSHERMGSYLLRSSSQQHIPSSTS